VPWLVAVAFFMEALDTTILNTAVPTIAAALRVGPLSRLCDRALHSWIPANQQYPPGSKSAAVGDPRFPPLTQPEIGSRFR
jgi:hypothetical protein